MESVQERSVSGAALVVGSLLVIFVIVGAGMVFGPALRQDVRQTQVPRTLREPVASGRYDGQVWEAIGRFDGTANCVELRFRGETLDRACDVGDRVVNGQIPPDGPIVAYGVAPEDQAVVAVTLDDGSLVEAPTAAGDLGFPVSFWAVELPEGRQMRSADAGS